MATKTGWTQALGLALVTLAGPAAAACVSVGTAYSPDGERVLYREQRRLLEFAGISDIRDDEGDRHIARVVFEYPQAGGATATGL